MYSATSLLALDRVEQQHELVAADPRQHVGVAQVQPEPLGHLHQQRVADRVAVIVVDVLEIVDVEKGQREAALAVVVLQQVVDAMLDHAPRRQIGELVIIGRAEQLSSNAFCSVMSVELDSSRLRPAMRTGRCEVRNTCLAEPRVMASSSVAERPLRSSSRQVSRRSLGDMADGAEAAASNWAVAASFTSTNSPCSSRPSRRPEAA